MPVDQPRKLWLRGNGKDMASETGSVRAKSITSLASVGTPVPFRKNWGSLKGQELVWKNKGEVISQDHFRHPHLGTSPGPQDLRAQQFQRSQTVPELPQGTAPGETWLLRACVWQQGLEQQGLEQGWETGCGGGWHTGSAESLQSMDYISVGRRTGRGGLRDTVERRLPVHGHCEGERERSKEGELGTQRARKKPSSERLPFSYTHPWRTPTQRKRASQPPKALAFLSWPAITTSC